MVKLYYYPAHCSRVSCDLSHARLWDTNTRDWKSIKQNQCWVWQFFKVFSWTSPKHNKSGNWDSEPCTCRICLIKTILVPICRGPTSLCVVNKQYCQWWNYIIIRPIAVGYHVTYLMPDYGIQQTVQIQEIERALNKINGGFGNSFRFLSGLLQSITNHLIKMKLWYII